MSTQITIAVPTHNRSKLLRTALASIAALHLPAGMEAECVVVDNRSTDDTHSVVAEFANHCALPTRYVYEGGAGSSHARNRAIEEARGDFILFIDDDAVAEPDWAAEMLAEIECRQLDVACGMVLPRWSIAPPRWLGPSLYVRLAVHDPARMAVASRAEREMIHNYFSANAGFRRRTFARFGNFRQDLGVIGGNPMSGEDTELFARIIAGGGAMGFAPRARVHHIIPPERMRRQYLRRKSYAFGYGSALAGGRSHNHLDKLVRNALRMMLALARGNGERGVYHELECANFFGYWRGRLDMRRARRT
ncbi:MAG: glycosyltransferase family 2 protein [Deltaproteobacteria bacterium]|nr:glycosyltransferase family 2 protein [Deltaproteobacteria bacterium]